MVFNIVSLHRDHKGSTRWLEQIVERIRYMAERFGADPKPIVALVWNYYAQGTDFLGLWAILDDEDRLIGHAVADIRQWDGEWIGWVSQIDCDIPAPRPDRDRMVGMFIEWVRAVNAGAQARQAGIVVKHLVYSTPHAAATWVRHTGFQEWRSLMRLPVRDL